MSGSRWWSALLLAASIVAPGVRTLAQEDGTTVAVADEARESTAPTTPLPAPPLPYTLRQGRALFLFYCATCHGVGGRGDGFNAYSLDPKPRDLSDAGFLDQRSDQELAAVIRSGGGAIGLSSAMPPWGRTLSTGQVDQLVAFLRELPASGEASGEP